MKYLFIFLESLFAICVSLNALAAGDLPNKLLLVDPRQVTVDNPHPEDGGWTPDSVHIYFYDDSGNVKQEFEHYIVSWVCKSGCIAERYTDVITKALAACKYVAIDATQPQKHVFGIAGEDIPNCDNKK